MTSINGEHSVVIQAPIEAVYDYVSDFSRHVEWNHQPIQMTKLTDGPVRVGSKFRTQEQLPSSAPWLQKLIFPLMKVVMGFEGYSEAEIMALTPNQRVAWKAFMPFKNGRVGTKAAYELRLQAQGDATILTQQMHMEFLGKMSERMNVDMAAKMSSTEMKRNLSRLKKVMETQTVPNSSSSSSAFT